MIKNCQVCNKEFKTKPSWVKKGSGKYCSQYLKERGIKMARAISETSTLKWGKWKFKAHQSPTSSKHPKHDKVLELLNDYGMAKDPLKGRLAKEIWKIFEGLVPERQELIVNVSKLTEWGNGYNKAVKDILDKIQNAKGEAKGTK